MLFVCIVALKPELAINVCLIVSFQFLLIFNFDVYFDKY